MKKLLSIILAVMLVLIFGAFAIGCGGSNETAEQGDGTAEGSTADSESLGDYKLVIESCRLARDYEGKNVVIVKYVFTNHAEDAASFMVAFDDNVFQNGVGLNHSYVLSDSANYSADNQTKEIQKGASIDVEVAYELNDSTTDIKVEVEQLFSFDDKKLTKTFKIAQ